MRTSRRLVVALGAALLLATAVGGASARNLSTSNQNLRVTFSSIELGGGGITIRCRATLEGSFHTRTIVKVARSLVGAVTRASIDEGTCTNGTARPRTETLPWHLTYEGFTGTLPNITSLHALYSRFRFQIVASGLCTADYGTATDNITVAATREGGGAITGLSPIAGRNTATLNSGTAFCPATARFTGTGSVTLLGTTTRVSITLI